jgi:hypothetical protein
MKRAFWGFFKSWGSDASEHFKKISILRWRVLSLLCSLTTTLIVLEAWFFKYDDNDSEINQLIYTSYMTCLEAWFHDYLVSSEVRNEFSSKLVNNYDLFRVFSSHDQEHMTCFIKRVLYVLERFPSHDIKLAKVHLRDKRNCDEFWRRFISDFARSEIIMKSSFETRHITNI